MKYFFKSFNNYVSVLYGIALNEFRSIRRNPVMLISGLVYLTVFFVVVGYFGQTWRQRAIPTALPYVIFRYMDMVQAIIASVIASQFWADDYHLNTAQAIHTRSFMNPLYIWGKTLGIAAVYVVLNTALLALIILVDLVFLSDVINPLVLYGLYALVIPLPTLVFATGSSYIVMRLVKHQGMAISILSGLFILLCVTAGSGTGFITDPTASELPLLYSDFVGFGNVRAIVLHRGMYVLLGLGLISFAAASFDRLRQSRFAAAVMLVIAALCFYGVFRFGDAYLSDIRAGRELRLFINELNLAHEKDIRISVTDCVLNLIHEGNEIGVTAKLSITNTNNAPIAKYLLSLNPGLEIQSITGINGDVLSCNRNVHLLTITPNTPLPPGGIDSLVIKYHGVIDENACYPNIDETERLRPHEFMRFIVDKRYAYITPQFVLLTPEALWYPIPGVYDLAVSGDWSGREFTQYTLEVITAPGLTAISQGAVEKKSETVTAFTSENPLSQISLVIGEYEQRTIDVDSVEVSLYLKPGHDFFSHQFTELNKTELEKHLEDMKQDFENKIGLMYPFPRFSLVEVPVSFLAYQRFRPYAPETVQPEQVFLPEKTAFMNTNFEDQILDAMRWPEVHSLLDAEKYILNSFFEEFFYISHLREELRQKKQIMQGKGLSFEKIRWNAYTRSNMFDLNIFPNYYWFSNVVQDDVMKEYDLLIGTYLRWQMQHMIYLRDRQPWDMAAEALGNSSFQSFLNNQDYFDIGHDVIELKSEEFVKLLLALSENDDMTFRKCIGDFLKRNKFARAEMEQFFEEYYNDIDINFDQIYLQWITADRLPKFEISDAECLFYNVQRSGSVYNMCATIMNVSEIPGIFTVKTNDIEYSEQVKNVFLAPGQSKKVGFVSHIPFSEYIFFNFFMSDNSYSEYYKVDIKSGNANEIPFEGVQAVPNPLTQHELGHIVIDNLDDGFSVLPAPPANKIRTGFLSWFSNADSEQSPFAKYDRKNPPPTWTLTRDTGFQGTEYGVHYVKSGDGNRCVQWETEIIRPGKYRIQFYVPDKRTLIPPGPGIGKLKVSDFHFSIYHDDEIAESVLDVKLVSRGWRTLGEFELSAGTARIVLSDKSEGKFVYADTVKFDIIE